MLHEVQISQNDFPTRANISFILLIGESCCNWVVFLHDSMDSLSWTAALQNGATTAFITMKSESLVKVIIVLYFWAIDISVVF